ncbi:MAG: hypothetical protein AAF558_03245 [Verrucomicrobiota bacterium]
MKAAGLLTLLYLIMAFTQPFMPSIFGHQNWLIGFTPILLAYAALRTKDLPLVVFVLAGGLVHDLLLLHYFGFGPLLWGCTIFVISSQRPWLQDSGLVMFSIIGFVSSFLYFSMDRLFYLLYIGFWSWDLELSFSLLTLALMNAVFSPLLFFLFDVILKRGISEPHRRSRYVYG